jgi:hypothetical protein
LPWFSAIEAGAEVCACAVATPSDITTALAVSIADRGLLIDFLQINVKVQTNWLAARCSLPPSRTPSTVTAEALSHRDFWLGVIACRAKASTRRCFFLGRLDCAGAALDCSGVGLLRQATQPSCSIENQELWLCGPVLRRVCPSTVAVSDKLRLATE